MKQMESSSLVKLNSSAWSPMIIVKGMIRGKEVCRWNLMTWAQSQWTGKISLKWWVIIKDDVLRNSEQLSCNEQLKQTCIWKNDSTREKA